MRKYIFILALIFPLFMGCNDDVWEIRRFDGINCFAATLSSPVEVTKECTCGGTGKVKTGDGLSETVCQCGDKCTCKKTKVKTQILYFGGDHCQPCRQMKNKIFPALAKVGWKISPKEGSQFHIIVYEADNNPKLVEKFKIESIPLFILTEDGVEVNRHEGIISAAQMGNFWNKKAIE